MVGENQAERLLQTLEQLLEIEATDVHGALQRASQLISEAMGADKVDVFLLDPPSSTLVALGVSDTPMGRLQRRLGLDYLPLANGGRTVEVFQGRTPYMTGRAHEDPGVLPGIRGPLGVRSMVMVPLLVNREPRGVLGVSSSQVDAFGKEDLNFVSAVARWIGMITYRAELVERIARDAVEQGRQGAAEELVAVLAHDLGNYVTPVRGRIELMRRRARREERERDVQDTDEALRGLSRIQRLISDLLDASRLEQGLFFLTPEPTDLALLVRETVDLLQAGDTRVRVQGPDHLTVEADPNRVRQALENLLSNALRYSPSDSPIQVELGEEDGAAGSRAVISVRDQGPGVTPDVLPTLFERFRSGPGSKGLGLGLYLSRGIAQAHGGTLTVESEPGRGSTFRLALPLDGAGQIEP